MDKKGRAIAGLCAVAIAMFCALQLWIIPARNAQQAEYALKQTDALTHDISAIEEYRAAYVGDASNVSGLFAALPLSDVPVRFEIDSKACVLTVNYLDTVWNIGEQAAQRDMVYNSVAAMAAIDNLAGIRYNFSGDSYSLERTQLEAEFGAPLSNLLEGERWAEAVQGRLGDAGFVAQFFA